jgi:hypothetical protein
MREKSRTALYRNMIGGMSLPLSNIDRDNDCGIPKREERQGII